MAIKLFIGILILAQAYLSLGEPGGFGKHHGPQIKTRTRSAAEIKDIKNMQDGGSRCPGVTCMPPPTTSGGRPCDPSYEENSEKCCPIWTCSSTMAEEDEEEDHHSYGSVMGRSMQDDSWKNFEDAPFESEPEPETFGPLNKDEARKHHYQQGAFKDGKNYGPYPKRFERNNENVKVL